MRRSPRFVIALVKEDARANKVAWVYLAIALVWGVVMVGITPPFQVPDESSHYFRAWSVADLQFVAGDGNVVTVPVTVATLPERIGSGMIDWNQNTYSMGRARQLLGEPIGAAKRASMTSAAGYGPIGYLPQAVGIDLARILGRSPLLALYLGRLCNLLVSLSLAFVALRLMPFGKPLLALAALLPMVMIEMASLSPDGVAITGFFCFLALLMRLARRARVTKADATAMLLAGVVLLNAKLGWAVLVLLVAMLRPRQFGSVRCYCAWVGATVGATLGLSGLTMLVAPAAPPDYLESVGISGVDQTGQLGFILNHPFAYARVLYHTFDQLALILVRQAYGQAGWLTVGLPVIGLFATAVVLVLFLGVRETIDTTRWERTVLLGSSLVYIVTVCTALYLSWTTLWAPMVAGLQGRYFIPVVVLTLFAMYGVRLKRERAILAILGMAAVLAAATTVLALIAFYY